MLFVLFSGSCMCENVRVLFYRCKCTKIYILADSLFCLRATVFFFCLSREVLCLVFKFYVSRSTFGHIISLLSSCVSTHCIEYINNVCCVLCVVLLSVSALFVFSQFGDAS